MSPVIEALRKTPEKKNRRDPIQAVVLRRIMEKNLGMTEKTVTEKYRRAFAIIWAEDHDLRGRLESQSGHDYEEALRELQQRLEEDN